MTGHSTFHVLIDKLGHSLEEIRIRALDNIISKINLGFINENDQLVRRDLLLKLLEWLRFDPCPEKDKVLRLILSLLKEKSGKRLIIEVGASNILSTLSFLKEEVDPVVRILINQIETVVSEKEQEESCANDHLESKRNSAIYDHSRNFTCPAGDMLHPSYSHAVNNQEDVNSQMEFWNCLHFMYLPWQPLIETDNHVLAAVEESLSSLNDPDLVLHTCNFFMDVMLQDFPAEVFLQKPTLVKIFFSTLDETISGTNKKVCSAMLKCLHKLATALLVRIHYYSDPSLANSKQEWCAESGTHSVSLESSHGTGTDDGLSATHLTTSNCDQHSENEYVSAAGDSVQVTRMKSQVHNIHFGSFDLKSKKYSASGETEDSILIHFQQMSLPMFCMQALYLAVFHRSIHVTLELIKLANCCISQTIWSSQDGTILEVVGKVSRVLELLGKTIKQHKRASQTDEEARLTYLQTLAVTRRFLVFVVPVGIADSVLPRVLKSSLVTSLLDYSLLCLMPELHHDLLDYCMKFTGAEYEDALTHYNNTITIASSMTTTVTFLKNYDRLDGQKILDLVVKALPSLAFHKAASFIRIVLEIYTNKIGRCHLQEDIQEKATKVILHLLSHSEPDIKQEMYVMCHSYVISLLGVDQRAQNPAQISFLFHVSIFIEIICHGVVNTDEKIKTCAIEMLIHFLKAKMFMPLSLWHLFIEQLIPTMPLLECYADKCTNLGRTILEMLRPKTAESVGIPKIEILKGNLRLLFAADDFVRSDALTRLISMLSNEERSYEKLPDIANVHVQTLISYMSFDKPLDITVPRKITCFYEKSSLCQVVEVLTSQNVEPRIFRSALSQIAMMMEDPHLHSTFLEQKGVDICLNIFQKALIEKDYNYYPDSVISVVNILKSLCFHNSDLRSTLSQDMNLYYCITRGFFMFGGNKNFRQDVWQILCLLLYSDYILTVPERDTQNDDDNTVLHPLSMPEIVLKNMRLPLLSRVHWHNSPNSPPSCRGFLLGQEDSRTFLRMCWTSEWFGGVKQILSWHSIKLTEQSEFSPDLRASESDLCCLKCTALNHSSKLCLYSIQNGTTHQIVEAAVRRMLGYITLQALLKERNEIEFQGNWKCMPWETTLLRFFGTTPACPEDEDLLISLLQFLSICVQHLSSSEIRKPQWTWVYRILKDPSQPLPCMLKMDTATVSKSISREILQLCQDCCVLEQQLEEDESGKNKADVVSWVYLVSIIAQNLKFSDTQHFYNLAFLDWMLSCLSHVTGSLGWSRGCDNTGQLMKDLIWYLAEIVTAFHCSKAGQSGTSLASFMGMSVTRNAIICMNHILCEMQNTASNRGWEAAWFSALTGCDLEGGVSLSWLPSLWLSRDPIIRCSALQLVAGLCSTQLGSRFLIQGLRDSPPDIWEVSLGVLIDHEEASMVREQAAIILTNLTNHGMPSVSVGADSRETSPYVNVHSFLKFLEDKKMFHAIAAMLNGLYLETTIKPGTWTWIHSMSADSSETGVSPGTNLQLVSQEDFTINFLTTPNLIKSVCWFLNNLLTVIPEDIVKNLSKYGLIKTLFETFSDIPDAFSTKMEIIHYVELVEMYIAISTVLAKCVCVDTSCLSFVLKMNDCLKNVVLLLNPTLYRINQGDLLHLRNRLWCRVFRLLSCFLTNSKGYEIISNIIHQCDPHQFLSTIENSINGKSSADLRNNALSFFTLLLSLEIKLPLFPQDVKTTLENTNLLTQAASIKIILDKPNIKAGDTNTPSSGTSLCNILMHSYEVQSLKHCSGDNKIPTYFPKAAVMGALSTLLAVSQDAKNFALKEGLLENIMVQLKEVHVQISTEAIDTFRKASEKKRMNAVFQEMSLLFSLLTNFLFNAPDVKSAAVSAGLADAVHKLWAWCYILPTLLNDTLKLLCTYTTCSIPACQSLVLTTPIVGVNARRSPTSNSLLHEVVNLVVRELENVGKGSNATTLTIAFHVLQNASHSQECRVVLLKSALFQSVNKLHPLYSKKQKNWVVVEMLWLPFLINCTCQSEGQIGLPKVPEALDAILALIDNSKPLIQISALRILRNVTFHQLNRPRLLSSAAFLQLLSRKLSDGSDEEKNMVIQMVWALVANNQKAKLVIKNSGIADKIADIVNHDKVIGATGETNLLINVFNYVLKIIYVDKKLRKS